MDISPYSHLLLDWGPNGVRKDPSVQLTLVQMGVVQLGLVQFGLQMGGGPLFPSHCQCAEQSTSQIDKILLHLCSMEHTCCMEETPVTNLVEGLGMKMVQTLRKLFSGGVASTDSLSHAKPWS